MFERLFGRKSAGAAKSGPMLGFPQCDIALEDLVTRLNHHVAAGLDLVEFVDSDIRPVLDTIVRPALNRPDHRAKLLFGACLAVEESAPTKNYTGYELVRAAAEQGVLGATALRAALAVEFRYLIGAGEHRRALRCAAEAGEARWMFEYGRLLWDGTKEISTAQESEGRKWMLKAIRARCPYAMYYCGVVRKPEDLDWQSFRQVARFLRRAAQSGFAEAEYHLTKLNLLIPPSRIQGDGDSLRLWVGSGMRDDTGETAFYVGSALLLGRYAPNEPELGMELLRESWKRGYVSASAWLSLAYFAGIGCPADLDESEYWLRQGEKEGCPQCSKSLAFSRLLVAGKPKSAANDIKRVEQSLIDAENDIDTLLVLAVMHGRGRGVRKSEAKAREFLERAVKCGEEHGQEPESPREEASSPDTDGRVIAGPDRLLAGAFNRGAPDTSWRYVTVDDVLLQLERLREGKHLFYPCRSVLGDTENLRNQLRIIHHRAHIAEWRRQCPDSPLWDIDGNILA